MFAELGFGILILTLLTAVYGIASAVYSYYAPSGSRNSDGWLESGRIAMLLVFPLTSLAVACLLILLAGQDFSVQYVYSVVNTSMPLYLRLTALWGGQAGSLLFWSWCMAGFASAAALRQPPQLRRFLPWVIVVCLDAGEKITGAAVCKLAAGSDPDGAARLAWVYVAPAWRGQLWGSRLVDQAAQQLRERGATHIEAEIETGERAIRSFLGSKGWYSLRLVLAPREQPYLVEWWQSSRYALKKNDQKLEAWLRKKLRSMRRPVVNQE